MTKQRKHKPPKRLIAQDDILSQSPSLDPGCDFQPDQGRSGFSQAKAMIKKMIEAGFEDIDIIIELHEKLPQDIAETALKECRQRGIL